MQTAKRIKLSALPYIQQDEKPNILAFLKERLIIKNTDKIHLLKYEDILYAEAMSNYAIIHLLSGEKICCSKPLKHYHNILEKFGFLRIHQSFLVNICHIQQIVKNKKLIIMVNGISLQCSVRKQKEIMQVFL